MAKLHCSKVSVCGEVDGLIEGAFGVVGLAHDAHGTNGISIAAWYMCWRCLWADRGCLRGSRALRLLTDGSHNSIAAWHVCWRDG